MRCKYEDIVKKTIESKHRAVCEGDIMQTIAFARSESGFCIEPMRPGRQSRKYRDRERNHANASAFSPRFSTNLRKTLRSVFPDT